MLLFVLHALAFSDVCQQVLEGAVTVTNGIFEGCQSTFDGGAVGVFGHTNTLKMTGCRFVNCSTDADGGALYVYAAHYLISECSFVSCYAGVGAPSACVESADSTPSQCSEISSLRASGKRYTVQVRGSEGSLTKFDHGNVTGSVIKQWGSGIHFEDVSNLTCEFCNAASNSGFGCIIFYGGSATRFRCLSVRSNVCFDAGLAYRGVICVSIHLSIEDSVFARNDAKFLADIEAPIVFKNCYFDTMAFLVTGGESVATNGCQVNAANLSWAPTCVVPSPVHGFAIAGWQGRINPVVIAVPIVAVLCISAGATLRWGRRQQRLIGECQTVE
jgi:hypothetical protein